MKKEYDFRKGKRGAILPGSAGKTRITIRIDDDVLAWFRERVHAAGGGNYQTLINLALRDQISRQQLETMLRRVLKEELARAIEKREIAYETAHQDWLRNTKDLPYPHNPSKRTWTRDDLHERHPKKKTK